MTIPASLTTALTEAVADTLYDSDDLPDLHFMDREEFEPLVDRLAAALAAHPSLAALAEREMALVAALRQATSMAHSAAAMEHLTRAGITQNPPHSGRFAECEAPWCIRNQERLTAIEAALRTPQP